MENALTATSATVIPLTLVFDVYGTLGDPGRVTNALANHTDDAAAVALAWRRHQLSITWLISLMERYEDFEAVTAYALDAALAEMSLDLSAHERADLLARYRVLELHDDVRDGLDRLEAAGCSLAILSNGSPGMLAALLENAGLAGRFHPVVSVDEVGVYKPSPAVYHHAAARLARPIEETCLVSANPFDLAGAKAAGMRAAKLQRAASFSYGFAPPPDIVAASLPGLAGKLAGRSFRA